MPHVQWPENSMFDFGLPAVASDFFDDCLGKKEVRIGIGPPLAGLESGSYRHGPLYQLRSGVNVESVF
jgi:hypothetical protein